MDGIHIVHECLHRLVYAAYGHVYGMLDHPFLSLDSEQVSLDIVIELYVLQMAVVLPLHVADLVYLFMESLPDERSHIEVECRYGLASMHLVLYGFHGNTAQNAGSLYPFGRTRLSVPGEETVFQNLVQRMLHACKAFCRVVVFVVDVDVAVPDSLFHILRQQAFIHEGLRGLGCEFHHHAGRGVGIHVRVLPGHIGRLGFDDFLEYLTGLCLSGQIPLVPVCYVFFRHFLSRAVHQLHLHMVLDVLHTHALNVYLGYGGRDFGSQYYVFPFFGNVHCLQYGIHYFSLVEIDNTPVTFDNKSDHNKRY